MLSFAYILHIGETMMLSRLAKLFSDKINKKKLQPTSATPCPKQALAEKIKQLPNEKIHSATQYIEYLSQTK